MITLQYILGATFSGTRGAHVEKERRNNINALLNGEFFGSTFSGIIGKRSDMETLVGVVHERIGHTTSIFSHLTKITETEDALEFLKGSGAHDLVRYNLQKQSDGQWIGDYAGNEFNGVARCMIIPLPENFFDLDSLLKDLGQESYTEETEKTLRRSLERFAVLAGK